MSDLDPKIAELEARLDSLVRTQIDFQTEISTIRRELTKLRGPERPAPPAIPPKTGPAAELPKRWSTGPPDAPSPSPGPPSPPRWPEGPAAGPRTTGPDVRPPTFGMKPENPPASASPRLEGEFSKRVTDYTDAARSDLEKFIGENLISKVGIVILVLGVGIGAKYAIDNGWISPLMRLVFGYVMGFGLFLFAARLKAKYLNFSAVLLSGSMAIFYFVTYFGYAVYGLIGQSPAFALMALFTVFTVGAAIVYNRSVIAHMGLVGAYAVPFLLSDNSGNYPVLFAYMSIINIGILAISIRKYWKSLFYTASAFTWLIFGAWFVDKYSAPEHFTLALGFLTISFGTFYATKIVHGVMRPESKDSENLVCIFLTAFIFYCFCAGISDAKMDTARYAVFFIYLATVTLAILITSFRYYGRVLIYLALPFTWFIYLAWYGSEYNPDEHFLLATVAAATFFLIFYVTTLIYRLATDDLAVAESMGLVLTNSFIFYGAGYVIMGRHEALRGFEGVYTVGHAAFHSLVAQFVSRFRPTAVDLVHVLAVLIITFSTIAVPVQFDGGIVTLIWSVEAAALFWFGRARNIDLFEYFSYPLMLLATGSLLLDWASTHDLITGQAAAVYIRPIANGDFITAIVFVAAFAFIYVTNRIESDTPAIASGMVRPLGYCVAFVALAALYNTFRIEISNYFYFKSVALGTFYPLADLLDPSLRSRHDLTRFSAVWQLNYTMFFLLMMGIVNTRKVRSAVLVFFVDVLGGISLIVFVTAGMYLFYELRISYLSPDLSQDYVPGVMNILIRYISYLFAGTLLWSIRSQKDIKIVSSTAEELVREIGFDALLYSTALMAASCELVNLMAQLGMPDSDKLGLSILWAAFVLLMIVLGIAWNKRHLRIAAITLLGVTLLKLFLYDVANLTTIPKTILLITVGLLMLIVSFLYNKYKALIFKAAVRHEDEKSSD